MARETFLCRVYKKSSIQKLCLCYGSNIRIRFVALAKIAQRCMVFKNKLAL